MLSMQCNPVMHKNHWKIAVSGELTCTAERCEILGRLYLWPPSKQRDSLRLPFKSKEHIYLPLICYNHNVWFLHLEQKPWHRWRAFQKDSGSLWCSGGEHRTFTFGSGGDLPDTFHTNKHGIFLSINDKTGLLTYRKPWVQLWWRVSPRWKGPRPQ